MAAINDAPEKGGSLDMSSRKDCNRSAGKDSIPDECDQRYERMDKLGEGTYGVVYKARDTETNEVGFVSYLTTDSHICNTNLHLDCSTKEDKTGAC